MDRRPTVDTALKCLTIFAVLVLVQRQQLQVHAVDVKIGALFDYNVNDTQEMFRYAVEALSGTSLMTASSDEAGDAGASSTGNNHNRNNADDEDEAPEHDDDDTTDGKIQLNGVTAVLSYGNEFQASKRVCKYLRNGITAIFGPMSASTSMHCTNICDAKEIPYVDFRWDANTKPPVINMMPHPDAMARVFVDLVRAWKWKGFTILYESAPWLPRAAALLQMYDPKEYTVTVRRINSGLTDNNYRSVLRRVRLSTDVHIVLECSVDTLAEVLKQAQQVGLMTDQHQFLITTPDMHTIDLEPFQYSGTNITGVRFVSPDNSLVAEVTKAIAAAAAGAETPTVDDTAANDEDDEEHHGADDSSAEGRDSAQNARGSSSEVAVDISDGLTAERMRTHTALVYDAVLLLTEALRQLSVEQIRVKRLNCNSMESWEHGNSITNFMRNTVVQGLTGEVRFDNEGLRTQFTLDIVELSPSGLITVGQWNSTAGLNMSRTYENTVEFDDNSLRNKTFRVITSLSAPYGMLKDSAVQLNGNDRFEGFGIDLIHELSLMLGFNYTFQLQDDGNYGSINNATGEWNGMIRKLHDDVADLAITDLTITSERESGVDFTMPFMNLGISILYRKPTKQPPSTFSFMSPFSNEVWIYLGGAYLGVSFCLFLLGRISPSEWDNPYPCIEEPTVLENQFSFSNALWFTIGALLQQGSEIAPKAASTRVVASIWWFFTLIIVSSYTANLAAFLTVETLMPVISSAEQLKDCYLGECPVEFGAKKGGSTLNFFKEAQHGTYKNMYTYMADRPELLTNSNEEGLQWTMNKSMNYAFLMESSSIEYIIERNCNVTQIGGLLDDKGYGIAMRKNSSYRSALSEGVLRLQELGKLTALKTKWWKEKKGGGACSSTGDGDGAEELGMANMNGVFLVLMIGSAFATVFGMIECFMIVYNKSKMFKVSFKEEFINEFKALSDGNTKRVRHRKSASLESELRAKSADSSRNRSNNSLNR